VFLLALSYCWAAADHPDATGEQMRTLASILKLRFAVTYDDGTPVYRDAAIFIDWCSLYQEGPTRRTSAQQRSFQRGVLDVNLWYAHERIESWLLSSVPVGAMPYEQRGWPTFEGALSSIITPDHMLLDIGKYENGNHWCDLFKTCKAGRSPPKVPAVFNVELTSKGFSVPRDLLQLQTQYLETFHLVMETVIELAFSNLDWIDDDAMILAEALPHCLALEKIDLKSNDICAAGAGAIFRAAAHCDRLEVISMTKNHLGDTGAQAISSAMLNIPRLRTLWLNECDIGDRGIDALMLQLPHSHSLRNFYVFDNANTDEGARVVINNLPECWFLFQMGIGGNPISEENIPLLQRAWDMVARPPGHSIYVR